MADLVVTVPSGTLTLPADVIVPAARIPDLPAGAVSSVNGETGAVVLDAADVGAATAAQGAKADAALPAANLDTSVTALDADAGSALRVQQDARLSSTFAPKPTGTPDGTKFLRDDNTWATPAGGGGGTTLLPGPLSGRLLGPNFGSHTAQSLSSANTLVAPIPIAYSMSADGLEINVTTSDASGSIRLVLYDSTAGGLPGDLVTSVDAPATGTGLVIGTISETLSPGVYWVGAVCLAGTVAVTTSSNVGATTTPYGLWVNSHPVANSTAIHAGYESGSVAPASFGAPAAVRWVPYVRVRSA